MTNDFRVRIAGSFEKDINKDFDFSVKQEFRFSENATRLEKSYTTLSIGYEVEKWLEFGINYRFILNRRGSSEIFGQRHRVMGDMVLKTNYHRFKFSNRVRLQSEIRTVNYKNKYGFSPATDLRNTIKVKYRINRIYRPHLSVDFRFLLRDAREPYYTGFDRHRIKAGVDITLSRTQSLDVYLMTSKDWNVLEPKQLFAIGINYTFSGR